ncbi:hypothetical protein AVEN_153836-1 [Araneus ventricosus]|uniref:Uncharacterized protein n=1 Tax=Araneus ventricosus TaxID=182803 RepID=A0A4Y2QA84_ARAVE|nr:hypothetical protein AVEN_153836-1 [Araneus ventricosus]
MPQRCTIGQFEFIISRISHEPAAICISLHYPENIPSLIQSTQHSLLGCKLLLSFFLARNKRRLLFDYKWLRASAMHPRNCLMRNRTHETFISFSVPQIIIPPFSLAQLV